MEYILVNVTNVEYALTGYLEYSDKNNEQDFYLIQRIWVPNRP